MCGRWEELNSLADQRRRLLAGAEQVHKFVRDAAETNDRMNEKVRTKNVCTCMKCTTRVLRLLECTFK